jgi:GNAT superfamily N-acetyltransferase
MVEARRCGAQDASELIRLREMLLTELSGGGPAARAWQSAAEATLRHHLASADGTWAAFAVDQSSAHRLAACALGVIEQRLGSPANPSGRVGCVFNVVTDPAYRRRGYARTCMRALLAWYRERGVRCVDLRATKQAEPIYEDLGFLRTADPAMRLLLPAP